MIIVACTPTKNRRWSWEFSKHCMLAQQMKPTHWVVVDNSSVPAENWQPAEELDFVIYERVFEPKTIGWLRNRCLDKALELKADYVVFWDDDDYYPPTRISTGVNALVNDPTADISASSKMYLLLTKENVLMTTGPFHEKHGTAATYTVRRAYAETHRFDPEKTRGEELSFTESWKAKLIQVPAEEMIVVMGHGRNTVDKSDLIKRPKLYCAEMVNSDNGKQYVRMHWPIPWSLFRSTFSV